METRVFLARKHSRSMEEIGNEVPDWNCVFGQGRFDKEKKKKQMVG